MRASAAEKPWFVQAFEGMYLTLYAHRGNAEAERHAPDLLRLLGIRAGQRLLDVACGEGRYARAFARRGVRVTGVDLSLPLLHAARQLSPQLPGAPQYVRADARRLPFGRQFEGAVSLFTSFGYFEDDQDDLRILQGVERSLVDGGHFVLDFLNATWVRATLSPVTETEEQGLRIRMDRRIQEAEGGSKARVRKRVHAVERDTGRVVADYEECVRLYTADEIDALLRAAGLEPEGPRLGGPDGLAFTPETPRLLRVATRRSGGGAP